MKKKMKLLSNATSLTDGRSGVVRLDYSCENHIEHVFETFGGEDLLKEKYPLVHRAILNTKEHHLAVKSELDSSNSDGDDLKVKVFGLQGIYYEERSLNNVCAVKGASNSENKVMIESASIVNPVAEIPHLVAIGRMDNVTLGTVLDSYFVSVDNVKQMEELKLNANVEDVFGEKDKDTKSVIQWNPVTEKNGEPLLESFVEETPVFTLKGASTLIKEFKIEDPKSNATPPNDPLIVLYGRGASSGETADYTYSDLHPDSNKNIEVKLPITGSITFADDVTAVGFSTGSQSLKTWLTLSNEGEVEYNHTTDEMSSYFTVDPDNSHKLNFDFNEDWDSKLDTSRFQVSTVVKLSSSFYVRVNYQGIPLDVPCAIRSSSGTYYTSTSPTVYIPSISIRWGCFEKNTLIRMADGKDTPINEIEIGDKVLSKDGKSLPVLDVITGLEEQIITIETDNGINLRVSDTHPVLTSCGMIQAMDLRPGHQLVMADGANTKVKFIYKSEYKDMVYNLKTSSTPEMLIANGLIAGDFEAQNSFEKESETSKPLSKATLDMIEQLKALEKSVLGCKTYVQKA